MPAVGRCAARRLLVALIVATLVATAAACGGGGGDDGGNGAAVGEAPGELMGVITELQRSGGRITGLTLKTDDGKTHQIALDPATDYGLSDETYEEHERGRNRLRVGVERRNGKLTATVILNA